ncbi:MAG: methyltransferase domain-containing protein [Methanonatronarchaeia archaeon]|nr:MAG: methyltransferase domain-containing protein [Methanonatronarchaeia archaeon]
MNSDTRLIFDLSGEHPDTPEGEVMACLEAVGVEYELRGRWGSILLVDVGDLNVDYLASRLAFTHTVSRFLSMNGSLKELTESASKQNPGGSYCVRAEKTMELDVSSSEIEKRVGREIKGEVDLDNPEVVYRVFIVEEGYLFGRQAVDVDRGRFDGWKPTARPYFSPIAINPRKARLAVNLSRAGPKDVLLDPFVGTGSLVIEGGLVEACPVGVDIDRNMLEGCRENLDFVGVDAELVKADALNLPLADQSIDSVVADPPYGRSSRVDAGSLQGLYSRSVEEMLRVLKKDGVLVLILPEGTDLMVGAKEIESYRLRVHRSLTRVIRIFRRN